MAWIQAHPEFQEIMRRAATRPAMDAKLVKARRDGFMVEKPERRDRKEAEKKAELDRILAPFRRDFAAQEARNSSLGLAGEKRVVAYEQNRLSRLGQDRLAGKVELVTETQGDGLGFDVHSFEATGQERFIEVKTTAFAKETPFFASASEISFSRKQAPQCHLYRLFDFRAEPKCFTLPGALDDHCILDPVSYRCGIR